MGIALCFARSMGEVIMFLVAIIILLSRAMLLFILLVQSSERHDICPFVQQPSSC